jgi:hypothetical protein
MGKITIVEDETGLVTVTFVGAVDDEAFTGYLDTLSKKVARTRPYAVILDATEAERPTALQRKRQAEWIGRHQTQLATFCMGTAYVIGSPLIRGALTAILWVQPPPNPHTVVGTLEEATRWARAQLGGSKRRA